LTFSFVSLKHKLFSIIATSPILLQLCYGQRKKFKSLVASKHSHVIIEGFPRSANTFAVLAFKHAQINDFIIAHHIHAEAQFKLAAKYNIPAIALLREPLEAVSSLLIRDPSYTIDQALWRYINFYTVVNELRKSLIIANFSDVTQNFNKIITQCNKKFHTNFLLLQNKELDTTKIFDEIKKINKKKEQGALKMLAMPSEFKDKEKSTLKAKIALSPLFHKANDLFNHLNSL
jgi:hypothetical protein